MNRDGRSLELRIPPLALVIVVAAAMAVVASLVPAMIPVPDGVRRTVAVALAAAGAVVTVAGVVAFHRHETTVNPLTPEKSSTLVATGVYRVSRNPMYLGFLLILVGWASYLGNWASALLLPAFVLYMNRFQIQPEERALTARFGGQFTTYTRTVRRWL